MADDELRLKITADDSQYRKAIGDSEKATKSLADLVTGELGERGERSLGALSQVVGGRLLLAFGAAAVAGHALKKSLDFTMAAERIDQIHATFNAMAESAKLAGKELEQSLMGAAQGLADDEAILESSSQAIVMLGENAKVIPATMELARKATLAFGGDVLSNFDKINQAIATGRTRQIQNIVGVIDVEKEQRKYAAALGITVDLLSEQGRRQAIANAVLEQGRAKMAGVNETTAKATVAYTQAKVAAGEWYDAFTKMVSKSDFWAERLNNFRDRMNSWADSMNGGTGSLHGRMIEQGQVMQELQGQVRRLSKEYENASMFQKSFVLNDLNVTTQKFHEAKNAYIAMQNEMKAAAKKAKGPSGSFVSIDAPAFSGDAGGKDANINWEAVARKKAQALSFMGGLERSAAQASFALREQEAAQIYMHGDRLAALDLLANDRRSQIGAEYDEKKRALRAQNALDHTLSAQQLAEAEVLIEQEKKAKIDAIQDASVVDFKAKQKELNDALYSTFKSGITNSIASFAGALAKGEDAFGSFAKGFLGMLGDMAIQLGSTLLFAGNGMQSLFAFQPAGAIAAGIGLIAIGGILKAFASSGGPEGGGGVASSPSNASGAITENPELENKKETRVAVHIHGNVWDRKETGMEIIDIINEQFSAGDGRLVRAV